MTTVQQKTPRVQVREWVREQIADKPEIRAPEVADEAIVAFGADVDLLAALGRQQLRSMVYELVLEAIAGTRHAELTIVPTESTDSEEERQKRLSRLERRYAAWLEHAGDRHVSLLEMTGADLDLAIAERHARIAEEQSVVAFLEAIRKRVRPNQKVKARLKLHEIAFIESATRQATGLPAEPTEVSVAV